MIFLLNLITTLQYTSSTLSPTLVSYSSLINWKMRHVFMWQNWTHTHVSIRLIFGFVCYYFVLLIFFQFWMILNVSPCKRIWMNITHRLIEHTNIAKIPFVLRAGYDTMLCGFLYIRATVQQCVFTSKRISFVSVVNQLFLSLCI